MYICLMQTQETRRESLGEFEGLYAWPDINTLTDPSLGIMAGRLLVKMTSQINFSLDIQYHFSYLA